MEIIIHDDGSKVEIAGEYPFFRRLSFIAFRHCMEVTIER